MPVPDRVKHDNVCPTSLINKLAALCDATFFTRVCCEGQEYQRPLHRIKLLLHLRATNQAIPSSDQQASHLCMDTINVDGRGEKHCANPLHMVVESDADNKARQRCAGWIWIHSYEGNTGGYWYPSCTHNPACLRFTPKTTVPTVLRQ